MTDGYVKLWRKLLEWPLWHSITGNQAKTMVTILLMADWKNGRLVSSQRKIAEQAGVSHKVVRNTEKLLESDHGDGPFLMVDRAQLGAHRLSVYTIVNFARYQSGQVDRGTEEGTSEGRMCPLGPGDVPPGSHSCAPWVQASIYKEFKKGRRKTAGARARSISTDVSSPVAEVLRLYEQVAGTAVPATAPNTAAATQLLDVSHGDLELLRTMMTEYRQLRDPWLKGRAYAFRWLPSRWEECHAAIAARAATTELGMHQAARDRSRRDEAELDALGMLHRCEEPESA